MYQTQVGAVYRPVEVHVCPDSLLLEGLNPNIVPVCRDGCSVAFRADLYSEQDSLCRGRDRPLGKPRLVERAKIIVVERIALPRLQLSLNCGIAEVECTPTVNSAYRVILSSVITRQANLLLHIILRTTITRHGSVGEVPVDADERVILTARPALESKIAERGGKVRWETRVNRRHQPIRVPTTRPVRRLARHMATVSLPRKITLMRDRVVKTTPAGGPSIVLDGVKNPTTNIRIVRTGSVNVRMPVRISTVCPALRSSRVKPRIKIDTRPCTRPWRRRAYGHSATRRGRISR